MEVNSCGHFVESEARLSHNTAVSRTAVSSLKHGSELRRRPEHKDTQLVGWWKHTRDMDGVVTVSTGNDISTQDKQTSFKGEGQTRFRAE